MITWTDKRRDAFTDEEWNMGLLEHIKAEHAPTRVRCANVEFEDYEGGVEDFMDACEAAGFEYAWRMDGSFVISWEA